MIKRIGSDWVKDVLIHLRFPFSFFLLPIFLFGWTCVPNAELFDVIMLFIILHLLVYPSSNGYNSLMDKDEGSIGGIKDPSAVPTQMFAISIIFDALALALTFLYFDHWSMLFLLAYILASRAYSYRQIRLKKYPVLGFMTVFIFQGAWIFVLVNMALQTNFIFSLPILLPALVASLIMGASYPLTQVYQHQQDANDGVRTLSMQLGIRGTFWFTIPAGYYLIN